MKVHITNIYGYIGTGAKAQNDVTKIAKSDLQYEELGIYRYPVESDTSEMLRTRLDGILASISDGQFELLSDKESNIYS